MDRKWWTLTAVCLGTFMLLLDITIVNVALPDIERNLGASFADLQWVVDAYALTLAAFLLTSGSLADLFGRRLLFAVGLVVFSSGSLLCGLARSPLWLIVSRSGQGIGGAIMFSTSLALLAQAFQGRERGTAFGVWGSVTGVAVAVGPVLGGVITTGISWRWIFLVNVPIGIFAVAVTLLRVDESRQDTARRPDWAGFATFTGALVALVYGLIRSSEQGWTDPGVLACFGGAVVLTVAFLLVERAGTHSMFDLALFRNPTFDGGSVAAFGISASLFALLLYIVLYLQDGLGYTALQTGLRLLVISAGIMVSATAAGRLTAKVPVRLLVGPGLLLIGAGLLLMARLAPGDSWAVLIPGFAVAGVGAGLVNPPLASTAVGVVPPERAGMASGINSTFRQVGIATGVAALGSIFGSELTHHISEGLSRMHTAGVHAGALAAQIRQGHLSLSQVPPSARAAVRRVAEAAFVHSLDRVLVIGAVIALLAGVLSLALIRAKDFAEGSQSHARSEQRSSPAVASR